MKTLLVTLSIFALSFGAQNAAVTKNASFNIEKVNANELYISLEADSDVYGLQFDLNYNADEITLTESDISHMFDGSDARSNMSVYSKIKEPGMARVIMFDLGGEAILNANNLEQPALTFEYVERLIVVLRGAGLAALCLPALALLKLLAMAQVQRLLLFF